MRGGHLSTPIVSPPTGHRVSRRDLLIGSARLAAAGAAAYAAAGRFAPLAFAQDAATPAAGGAAQELVITITDSEMTASTETLKPGYVLVTVENKSQTELSAGLMTLPGLDADMLAQLMATPVPQDEIPPFLLSATIAGGPGDAAVGGRSQATIHVTPGNWAIFSELSQPPLLLTVTEGDEVGTEPEATVTVQEPDFLFAGLDAGVPAGKQTWKVVNTGSQPHMLVMGQIPANATREMVMEVVMRAPDATPAAGQLTENDYRYVGGVLLQSPEQTVWPVLDLAPGRYVAACWVPDPENGGIPHAMEGMISVFDVGA
jgi:hypothetical protein